jgi:phenylpropionate dioxygenase-like ring-hydroxylating dioxygenase large terminal subunit
VSSYPTRCAEGLLWVWPDASPTALIESADPEAWPGLAPELDTLGDAAFSRSAAQHKWYARCVRLCAGGGVV